MSKHGFNIGGNVGGDVHYQFNDQSVTIGTGAHHNTINQDTLDTVALSDLIEELQHMLEQMDLPEKTELQDHLKEAKEELTTKEPDQSKISSVIKEVANAAKHLSTFQTSVEKLKPTVTKLSNWLIQHNLLSLF